LKKETEEKGSFFMKAWKKEKVHIETEVEKQEMKRKELVYLEMERIKTFLGVKNQNNIVSSVNKLESLLFKYKKEFERLTKELMVSNEKLSNSQKLVDQMKTEIMGYIRQAEKDNSTLAAKKYVSCDLQGVDKGRCVRDDTRGV
jgi:anion-transporting  ArsA/GET3 family ATPase